MITSVFLPIARRLMPPDENVGMLPFTQVDRATIESADSAEYSKSTHDLVDGYQAHQTVGARSPSHDAIDEAPGRHEARMGCLSESQARLRAAVLRVVK
ncbi:MULTISPECIES: hypothetical protein [Bradyrhizobium]